MDWIGAQYLTNHLPENVINRRPNGKSSLADAPEAKAAKPAVLEEICRRNRSRFC
jgi:hypothetical protein